MPPKKENAGCGCASIPISFIVVFLGVGCWGLTHLDRLNIGQFLPDNISKLFPNSQQPTAANLPAAPVPVANSPLSQVTPTATPTTNPQLLPSPAASITPNQSPSPAASIAPKQSPPSQTAWEKKQIRGIYLSRYKDRRVRNYFDATGFDIRKKFHK